MYHPQPHEMRLERTHPSGSEEWFCPRCGRRFLIHWAPIHSKTILAAGDENACHTGGISRPSGALLTGADTQETALAEGLRPWSL